MFVYIAGPFFNPEQLATIAKLENLLNYREIEYFSPRRSGILLEMTESEKKDNADKIYQLNVDNLKKADTIVAVIDDRDVGTIWEIGFAAALNKDIITYTSNDYGLNVMLAKCVRCHTKHISEIDLALHQKNIRSQHNEGLY